MRGLQPPVRAPQIAPMLHARKNPILDNLVAFARVFGCVRFFHPSDQAKAIDWNKLAVIGAELTLDAPDGDTLRRVLRQLFEPIAPGIELADPSDDLPGATAFPSDQRITYWRHYGVGLGPESNIYASHRVGLEDANGPSAVVFLGFPPPPKRWVNRLTPNLVLGLPLTLAVAADGRTLPPPGAAFEALQLRLASIADDDMTASDWRVRVAGVVSAWNVFQHFHPYLEQIGTDWHTVLRSTLERTLSDHNAPDYYATLSEMVAKLEDGHGHVFGRPAGTGELPLLVETIEEQLVVTRAAEGSPCRKGDVVVSVDGGDALELLREHERYFSGSPQLCRFRALDQFGQGPLHSLATVEIRRGGKCEHVELRRVTQAREYFYNPLAEIEFPSLHEVRPGLFYVSLRRTTAGELRQRLPELAAARGVIFDTRRHAYAERASMVQPDQDIIPHLIDEERFLAPMRVPCITRPDREGWRTSEGCRSIAPKQPRFTGRVVFINEPNCYSYGETCMAVIAHYRLATTVGAPTGGCNGNINIVSVPGGFRIMWTGMEVVKHDGSALYGVGYPPDYPVAPTLEALRAGRDEYLEKAIEVLESEGYSGL